MSNNKSFSDFLKFRWHNAYKPILLIGLLILAMGLVVAGFIMGASEIYKLLQNIHPNIFKIGLPIISLFGILFAIEYNAYKAFMRNGQSYLPTLDMDKEV